MIKPIQDRILVLRDDQEETTKSGIILPEDKLPQGTGIVMGVGPKVEVVKVGQRVLFKKLDGHDYREGGKDYVILKEFNIQAVYK